MAQQDKTDWYWNGVLAGAVNNLYYDFINVDVVRVPYATHHRNSSFFLRTRLAYDLSNAWRYSTGYDDGFDVTDVKIIWDEECSEVTGTVYALARNQNNKRIYAVDIKNGCVSGTFFNCSCEKEHGGEDDDDDDDDETCSYTQLRCGDWKLFTTDYVRNGVGYKNETVEDSDCLTKKSGTTATEITGMATGIQINKIIGGRTQGYFSDENIENGYAEWSGAGPRVGNFVLVYRSDNGEESGFAGQVRLISAIEGGRLFVNEPWEGFTTWEGEDKEKQRGHVKYAFFSDWGEVLGYTDNREIRIMYNKSDCASISVYNQTGIKEGTDSDILGVAATNNKIFVLTASGYVHYNNGLGGRDKFFIQDSMYAGADKYSITSYRDMVLAFGRKHIAIGVPDENNERWHMYDQSTTIGLWSRYAYAEYDGDMIVVSNDKRLLAFTVANTVGRYMLQHDDVGAALNSKLSALRPGDEAFVGVDNNNLKIFINTTNKPYDPSETKDGAKYADISSQKNNMTHVYKYDKAFSVFTEDHVNGILLRGANEGVYFGKGGIYIRNRKTTDYGNREFKTIISAYLIENETDWVGGSNSWLANRPKLYNIAKLNRLITTLGPGEYSENVKIRITNYSKGIGYVYEFPVNGDGNTWLGLITDYYTEQNLSREDREHLQCMVNSIPEEAKQYLANPGCSDDLDDLARIQAAAQQQPWCDSYAELMAESHNVCINDKLFELAPTMPLVTNLGEIQDYSTQIKIELIGGEGDIICFGGRLAEMFIAPLFSMGPDGEYQLAPNTECD